jgi:DNA-binding CsgD family transcriptional regulator
LEVNVGSAATARAASTKMRCATAAGLLRIYDPEAGHGHTPAALPLRAPAAGDGPRLRTLRLLFEAQTAEADGRLPEAQETLKAAVESNLRVLPEQRPDDPTAWSTCAGSEPDLFANLGNTAMHLGEHEIAHDCYTRVLTDGRHTGAVTVVLYALPRVAFTQLLRGQWDDIRHGAHEAVDLATSVGQPALAAGPLAWLALLAALQGDVAYEQHEQRAAAAGGQHLGVFAQLFRDLQRWAVATVSSNAGDHHGALPAYSAIRVPTLRRMTAVERITAAARAGERVQAQRDLEELAAFAIASRLPWALAAAEHARAELAPSGAAVDHLERALAHHQGSPGTVDRARTQLALGELLRRSQRRMDARVHLRAALVTFEQLSAEPLAARARTELRASGETARKRDPSTQIALTPMEAQVARLVAQGLSNKDVATQLWISPRTVAFHLRGVFAKHGISSRGELGQLRP